MIRDAAMRVGQRGDRFFRWRGAEVSRVETLFDAVIARYHRWIHGAHEGTV